MNLLSAFGKHVGEFVRAVRNGKYELTPEGVLFPQQGVLWHGQLGINRNGGAFDENHNIAVLEGRNYMLNAMMGKTAAFSHGYIAPFATNTDPQDDLTAALFNGTQTEFTNYSETTRQEWVAATSTTGVLTNAASVATITIDAATGPTNTSVYGAGVILNAQGKGATTGVLLMAALGQTAKTGLEQGETLGFRYSLTLTSA